MAIAFDATLGTVTNTATLTTSAAAAAGSRVFAFVWWYKATGTCTGMSAGGGLTWVVDNQAGPFADAGSKLAVLSADAPAGLASSTNLTPSFSVAPDFGPGIAAHSWTGVATGASGYVDDLSFNTSDFLESWLTANIDPATDGALLFGISVSDSASHSEIANYTERHDWLGEGSNRVAVVSRVAPSAGTYNAGGTWSGTVTFQSNFGLAYKAGGDVVVPANVAAREFNGGRFGPF